MPALTLAQAMSLALDMQQRGEGAVVVTIVSNRSGAPAPLASRLVAGERGRVSGTIAPALDDILLRQARLSLEERRSRSRSYSIRGGEWRDVGVQGGEVDVFFEVLARPPRLIIVGAGHIAVPLSSIGSLLDFQVTVIDDRPEYATRDRFPSADEILVGEYRATISALPIDRDTYIVLVTRGHVHDLACLEAVIEGDAAYIGMIGSRQRVRTVLTRAREHGYDPDQVKRIHAPVGLDIGAQSPAEIAVAIAAEIVATLRGGASGAPSLAESRRV